MAWTTGTFAGAEATGSPSGWRTTMFEFCRAINEREDCFPLTLTQFRKADGTLAANPLITDFLGMDPAGSYALENWEKIMAWIWTNVGRFTTTSGGVTNWTKATLETDIDMFAFLSAPRSTTDALFFQQCKEAFDRLIYGRTSFTARNYSGVTTADGRNGYSAASVQDAWDDARADSPSSSPIFFQNPSVVWRVDKGITGVTNNQAFIRDNFQDVGIAVPDFKGTVAAAFHSVRWVCNGGFFDADEGYLSGTMSCLFLGNSYSTTGLARGAEYIDLQSIGIGGLTRGATNYVNWNSNQPMTVPITTPTDGYSGEVYMYLGDGQIFFDIAAELTDQA